MHLPTMHTDPELLLEHRAAALAWARGGRGGCWLCHRLGAGEHSEGEGAGAGPGRSVHTPPDRLQSHWLRALPVARAVWWQRPRSFLPPVSRGRPAAPWASSSHLPRPPSLPGTSLAGATQAWLLKPGVGGRAARGPSLSLGHPPPHSTLMHTSRLPAELGSRVSSSPEDSTWALL